MILGYLIKERKEYMCLHMCVCVYFDVFFGKYIFWTRRTCVEENIKSTFSKAPKYYFFFVFNYFEPILPQFKGMLLLWILWSVVNWGFCVFILCVYSITQSCPTVILCVFILHWIFSFMYCLTIIHVINTAISLDA